MAIKQFRLGVLTPDERRVLQQLAKGNDELIQRIEKTGKIPPELISGLGASEIASLQPIFAKVAGVDVKEQINRFIKDQGDEAGLSEEQLRERLQGFQELETGETSRNVFDIQRFGDAIFEKLKQADMTGFTSEMRRQLADFAASRISQGDLSGQTFNEFANSLTGYKGDALIDLGNTVNAQFRPQLGTFTIEERLPGDNRSEDVRRVQDLISGLEGVRAKEGQIQSFLTETPKELKADRQTYLASLEAGGARYLSQRFLPSTLKELTRRGLATNAGEVTSLLAAETGKVQETIEKQYADLEQQDNMFFADAAFRLQQTKLDLAEDDFRRQIDFERAKTRQDQQQRFVQSEKGTQAEFDKTLLEKELARKRSSGVTDIELGKSEASRQGTARNLSTIGEGVGNIAAGGILSSGGGGGSKPTETLPKELGK